MNDELIEKMARAICEEDHKGGDFGMMGIDAWEEPRGREVYIARARAAHSAIRGALSEPSLQAEVDRLRVALARIEHECIIRQPATAVQTVKDVRAIAREAIALSYCVYNPIGEK